MLGVVVFSQIIPFVIVNVLFFAFHSVSLPLLQTLVAEDVKSNQSSLVMGFYNAVRSLGGIAGALFSGLLYKVPVHFWVWSVHTGGGPASSVLEKGRGKGGGYAPLDCMYSRGEQR